MTHRIIQFEECPLQQHSQCQKRPRTYKGPLRVVRLCILGIALPTALISIPLYLRYHVYANQLYPFAVSDMRLLDRHVSTVWCQKQLVSVNNNATFNAFLLSEQPDVARIRKTVSMERNLLLEDDMKEYWGFYLLAGSTVTVSTCVRWPGASLIVIRGHKHLHECAYIGDDSSEELEEILEAMRDGTYVNTSDTSESDGAANAPQLMKRHRPDVRFHHPLHENGTLNHSIHYEEVDVSDITDPKLMKTLLEALSKKTDKMEKQRQQLLSKIGKTGSTKADGTREKINISSSSSSSTNNNKKIVKTDTDISVTQTQRSEILTTEAPNEEPISDALQKLDELTNDQNNPNNSSISAAPNLNSNEALNLTSSEELFREVSQKLDALGDRRHKVLHKLNNRLGKNSEGSEQNQSDTANSKADLDQLLRRKRDLLIATAFNNLNSDDEKGNAAIEEDFVSDGIADHRGSFNETTLNDRSNSEFWSSFSSSEEALLNCAGLILNLPLTPHPKCQMDQSENDLKDASLANTITYLVPQNGYYFFVFNSENEVQVNYIRVRFELNKTMYDVSHPVSSCANTTEPCALDLKFFSNERTVMEVPVTANDSLWNEEFVVVSECQPRTMLYALCVLSVPIIILVFAFGN